MEIIYILSFALAEMAGINEAQALGLFSLAIKDGNKKIGALSYDECREVINVPLKARLEKLKVADPGKVTTDLLGLLAKKQSLFVMSSR